MPRSERMILVVTDQNSYYTYEHYRTATVLNMYDSLEIISALPNRPFNVAFLNPTNALLSLAKHQQIATALSFPSTIIHSKCDEPPVYTSNPPLPDSVNLVHHQPHVVRLQQMSSHNQVEQEEETSLSEDW